MLCSALRHLRPRSNPKQRNMPCPESESTITQHPTGPINSPYFDTPADMKWLDKYVLGGHYKLTETSKSSHGYNVT